MMKKSVTKLLPILIPVILLLNLATPQFNAKLIMHEMFNNRTMTVYSFLWIPLLEASVLVTEHIMPAPTLAAKATSQAAPAAPEPPNEPREFVFNVPAREPFAILQKSLLQPVFLTILFCIVFSFTPIVKNIFLIGFMLLPVSLLPLFKPLLPRSDIPPLPCH